MGTGVKYADDQYVREEIVRARKHFTNAEVTEDQWRKIQKGLAYMLLNCNPEMVDLVHATLEEMGHREFHMHQRWAAQKAVDSAE